MKDDMMFSTLRKILKKPIKLDVTSDEKININIPEIKNNKTSDDKSPVYYIVKQSTVIGNLFDLNKPLSLLDLDTIVKSYVVIDFMDKKYIEIHINDEVFHCSIDVLKNITYIKPFDENYYKYYNCDNDYIPYCNKDHENQVLDDIKKTTIDIIKKHNFKIQLDNKIYNVEDIELIKDSLILQYNKTIPY